jgi:membrane-associated phospholipid phosphatase
MRYFSLLLLFLLFFTSLQAQRKGGALRTYGDVARRAIPVAAALISVVKKDLSGVIQLAATALVTEGLTEGIKRVVDKRRPDGGYYSFPSGHTSAAFAGASYLHYRYGWPYGVPAYIAAGVVAYSRVHAHRHDWADVVGGALLANAVAFFLVEARCCHVRLVPLLQIRKPYFGIIASIGF